LSEWLQSLLPLDAPVLSQRFHGRSLPRYQACIAAEQWKTVWQLLKEPLEQHHVAFKQARKGMPGPDVQFGVMPRFIDTVSD